MINPYATELRLSLVTVIFCAILVHPGGAAGQSPADDEELREGTRAIANGDVWDPWTASTHLWTRNIVSVRTSRGACTGTLLNREWVITAGHCFSSLEQPITVSVRHTGQTGAVEVRGAREIHRSPLSLKAPGSDDGHWSDVELIYLDEPLDGGVGQLSIYDGDTDALVGTTVTCAGYGSIGSGTPCNASTVCPQGEKCNKHGACTRGNDGRLRIGSFTIVADGDHGKHNPKHVKEANDVWYRLNVPNADGQSLQPGDSGSACSNGTSLTGIHKAGGSNSYNRQSSAEVFRNWAKGIAQPQEVSAFNLPGALCSVLDGAEGGRVTTNGQLANDSGAPLTVVCPVGRPGEGAEGGWADVVSAPRVFVIDRHPTQDVCCHVQSFNPANGPKAGAEQCSSGVAAGYQSLNVPSIHDGPTWGAYQLVCTLPGADQQKRSSIHTYRITQNNRS